MKKTILCIFGLVFFLLVVCTISSRWIEKQMTIRVEVSERNKKGSSFSFRQSVLFNDTQGEHLFELADGKGWSNGLRINELLPTSWYRDSFGTVNFAGTKQKYLFVISASRQPEQGEKVEIINNFTRSDDYYLYIYSSDIPKDYLLPHKSEIVGMTQNVLLIKLEEVKHPFLRQTAISQTESTRSATEVFSLTEVKQFLNKLPFIVILGILLFAGTVFLIAACFFGVHSAGNKFWIKLNIGLSFVSLIVLDIMYYFIELPTSMLPEKNIFDFQHYNNNLSVIYSALDDLKMLELLPHQGACMVQCIIVGVVGVIAVLGVMIIECVYFRKTY